MTRDAGYRRYQRSRAIRKKKGYIKRRYGKNFDWYRFDGMYSKGKVHCSCGMCCEKNYRGGHLLTIPEKIAIEYLNEVKKGNLCA